MIVRGCENMPSYEFDEIFTIEARSNILLSVMTARFNLSESRVFKEITSSWNILKSSLDKKNIKYRSLKNALIPSIKKNEAAFVFDWELANTSWYGKAIIESILPVLNRDSTHSILCGDWIYGNDSNEFFCNELAVNLSRRYNICEKKCSNIYFVYINNLSDLMMQELDTCLRNSFSYLGYLDLKYTSPIKSYISTFMIHAFIKHKSIIIQPHEDDRLDSEDVNLLLYDFEKFNYSVKSIPFWLYGIFLSYKIECPVFKIGDEDARFCLNAISNYPIELEELDIILEDKKLNYLQSKKFNSLKKADFHKLTLAEISTQIKSKIKDNYIYNLARSVNGKTIKFNIILENENVARNECALEFIPDQKQLRVLTFY